MKSSARIKSDPTDEIRYPAQIVITEKTLSVREPPHKLLGQVLGKTPNLMRMSFSVCPMISVTSPPPLACKSPASCSLLDCAALPGPSTQPLRFRMHRPPTGNCLSKFFTRNMGEALRERGSEDAVRDGPTSTDAHDLPPYSCSRSSRSLSVAPQRRDP